MRIDFKSLPITEEAVLIEEFLTVVDKGGNEIPFVLNDEQRYFDAYRTNRTLVPKARQKGMSTLILAIAFIMCLKNRNFKAVIVSHEKEATQRLLERVHFFADTFPRRTGREIKTVRASANEIAFAETNSKIYIGTAGSRAFGRGDTINFLHCSEYAYWENGLNLLNGLMDAVPAEGIIYIESTGQGVGNDYHSRCAKAAAGDSYWNTCFIPWHWSPEYQMQFSNDNEREAFKEKILAAAEDDPYKEKKLFLSNQLTLEQLLWRRRKLEDKDMRLDLFEQEYPMVLDEAFQTSGASIFRKVNYSHTDEWQQLSGNLYGLPSHPRPGCGYVIGADPSGGVGLDNAVAVVLEISTGEQVAEFASDRCQPDTFGHRLRDMGKVYNTAFIGVEANNHGPVTLDNLRGQATEDGFEYPLDKIYDSKGQQGRMAGIEDVTLMDLGIKTTVRSKPIIIGQLNRALAAAEILIHSALLNSELGTFIETDTGKLEADQGCKDDRVIALAVACAIWNRALLYWEAEKETRQEHNKVIDPFCFERIFQHREYQDRLYGMSQQHASAGDRGAPFSRRLLH